MKRRHLALVVVRGTALAMLVYGGFNVIWGLGTGIGLSGMNVFVGVHTAMTNFWSANWNPFWCGVALVIPGIVLLILDRHIVRWLVPLARNECPQCGYALRQLSTTRCPECGLALDSSNERAAG